MGARRSRPKGARAVVKGGIGKAHRSSTRGTFGRRGATGGTGPGLGAQAGAVACGRTYRKFGSGHRGGNSPTAARSQPRARHNRNRGYPQRSLGGVHATATPPPRRASVSKLNASAVAPSVSSVEAILAFCVVADGSDLLECPALNRRTSCLEFQVTRIGCAFWRLLLVAIASITLFASGA